MTAPVVLRSIIRYIPSYGLYTLPAGREMRISLIKYDFSCAVVTPFSCLPGKEDWTDDDLIRIARDSFATIEEAEAEAKRLCPFAGNKRNEEIRTEVIDARHYHGKLVGSYRVADAYGVSVEDIHAIARGAKKAPRKITPIKQSRI